MTRQAIAPGRRARPLARIVDAVLFEEDRAGAEQVRALAREAQVPILLGSDQIERGSAAAQVLQLGVPRAAGRHHGGVYRKMHLVPFGEYVPLKRLLFFAAPLVEACPISRQARTPVLLPVERSSGQHRDLLRDRVSRISCGSSSRGGSELLTTITNDAWFGATSAPYQHFAQASMRAIENGRYLVRAANTGISGIVDPYGRVLARAGIFEPAVIVGEARFLRTPTVYTRIGDVFAYARPS